MDHNSRLAGGDSGVAGALGSLPSGSYSSALGQPVGVPALALPGTSSVAWTWYLGVSPCPLEKTVLIPGLPCGVAMKSQGVNTSSKSLDEGLAWRERFTLLTADSQVPAGYLERAHALGQTHLAALCMCV